MTKVTACRVIFARARASGLSPDDADAVVHRVLEIWHSEFTQREVEAFTDQEIERHANP